MRDYEFVMILSPEVTEAEAADTVSRVADMITDGGGNIADQDNWGVRRLAYPIQRFIEGNYFITRCRMDAQAAVELNTTLNSMQDVLRYLVFKLEKSEIAAMDAQAERDLEAQRRAEARATAERQARERDEARRAAADIAAVAAQETRDRASADDGGAVAAEGQDDASDSTADDAVEPVVAEAPVDSPDQEQPTTQEDSSEESTGG